MDNNFNNINNDCYFFDEVISPIAIKNYLNSNNELEKLIGMKFILANLSKGKESSHYFPDVVKNVVVKNIEVFRAVKS